MNAAGYATESEVSRDGLRTLQARDATIGNWPQGNVTKRFNEYAADPSTGILADEVMVRLRTKQLARLAKIEKAN